MPRDSSGAYTLPSGNPVVDGTVIESEWANGTMSDIAIQLNNVLTRDGLLGPTKPMLFVNGTEALPGIAFQESPSTGFYRTPPNTVGLSINGVTIQRWDNTGTFFALAQGSPTNPSLWFVGDTDTGIYQQAVDTIGFTIAGIRAGLFTAGGLVVGPVGPTAAVGTSGKALFVTNNLNDSTALSNATVVVESQFRNSNLQLRFKTSGANSGGLQFYDDAGVSRGQIQMQGTNTLVFQIATVDRMIIAPTGQVSIAAPTAAIDTLVVNAADSSFGINIVSAPSGLKPARMRFTSQGSRIWGTGATITDMFSLKDDTRGAEIYTVSNAGNFTLNAPASGVHTINGSTQFTGPTIGNSGDFVANNFYLNGGTSAGGTFGCVGGQGASTVYWGNASAGAGKMDLYAGGLPQVGILPIAGAVNQLCLSGGSTGNRVALNALGNDANIGMQFTAKGTGDYAWFGNGGVHFQIVCPPSGIHWLQISGSATNPVMATNGGYIQLNTAWIETQVSRPPPIAGASITYAFAQSVGFINQDAPNKRVHEWYHDPAGGGFQGVFLNDAGSGSLSWLKVDGNFQDGVASIALSAMRAGVGQVIINTVRSTAGLTVADTDNAGAGANIKLQGNGPSATPNKYIRATNGDFQVLRHDYAGLLLSISDAGTISDARSLSVMRDPGAAPATNVPVGGLVVGQITGSGFTSLPPLSQITLNTTNFITPTGNSGVFGAAIQAGVWRFIGLITGNQALMMRMQ